MKKHYLFLCLKILIPILATGQVTTVIDDFNNQEGNRLLLYNEILYYSLDTQVYFFNINDVSPTPSLLIDGMNDSSGMAQKDGFLYLARFITGDIIKLDLSDQNPNLISVTFSGLTPNMLEFEGNDLYYTDTNGFKIYKYDNTSVGASSENFLNTTSFPIGIAIKDNFLYYSLPNLGTIERINLNDPQGTSVEVASGLDAPIGIEFNGDDLYIADLNSDKVVKVNIVESPPVIQDIVTNLNRPLDITFDGDIMYIIEETRLSKIDLSLSVSDYDLLGIKLYPNPTKDYLSVSNLITSYDYYISDINGRILLQGKLSPNNKTINISSFNSGTYFITLNGEISTTEKFLKQ